MHPCALLMIYRLFSPVSTSTRPPQLSLSRIITCSHLLSHPPTTTPQAYLLPMCTHELALTRLLAVVHSPLSHLRCLSHTHCGTHTLAHLRCLYTTPRQYKPHITQIDIGEICLWLACHLRATTADCTYFEAGLLKLPRMLIPTSTLERAACRLQTVVT